MTNAESEPKSDIVFDDARASSYDKRWAKLAPMRDALHLFMGRIFADLPERARVLCVGAGTGQELVELALANPGWRFTAVDPAAPMLDVCRARAEAAGVASRCEFHAGYLDSLPTSEPFDAATCVLVSHFLTDLGQRRALFESIAARLKPAARLISADLAGDMASAGFARQLEVWLESMRYAELPAAEIEKLRGAMGDKVAVLPPRQVADLIASAGFEAPVLMYQAVLMHAWSTRCA